MNRARFAIALTLLLVHVPVVVGCAESARSSVPAAASAALPERVPVTSRGRTNASHDWMLAELQRLVAATPDEHPFLGEQLRRQFQERVASLPEHPDPATEAESLVQLAEQDICHGDTGIAVERLLRAVELTDAAHSDVLAGAAQLYRFRLGVAWLRSGENENCCLRHNSESCLLPIRRGGIHTRPEGARAAAACFEEVLAQEPPTSSLALRARWLLNLAHMTLGSYPQGVPVEYVIPPEAFASTEPFPRFENIAPGLGLDSYNLAGGVVCDDVDGDGLLDLLVSEWHTSGQLRLYHNRGDGTFADRTVESGLGGILGGLNMIQADFDNDGFVDVYVIRGAWCGAAGCHPDSLLRNLGDGTFVDMTLAAGLADVHYPSQTAGFADYDVDGDLDLYVGGESDEDFACPCQLFRNEANGRFTDVARAAGVTNDRYAKGVSWGDYDEDGRLDLYVSNLRGENRLYRNLHDGTFRDMAVDLGVTRPLNSFPTWFWDFDNDGTLDLWVGTYLVGIDVVAASYLGLPYESEAPCLYRGDGAGRFSDVALPLGVGRPMDMMGCNFGDLDNDGFLDLYLGTGNPSFENLVPNLMYRNRGGTGFSDVTADGGFGHLQKGHAVTFADLDLDGDQDVFEQIGGACAGDAAHNALFENPGFDNRWLTVRLVGCASNRSGIGARLHVVVQQSGGRRSIYKHVNSGGSFGANSLRQSIGLGQAERVESLEILWPNGKRQVLHDLPLDSTVQVIELDNAPRIWSLPKSPFHR
jgi:hypothetical protein